MADGFTTPPRAARAIAPSSPPSAGEIEVKLVAAVSGVNCGSLKVTSETRLIDVHGRLLAAIGGQGFAFEAHLVKGTDLYDKPFGFPFKNAVTGDVYGIFKVPMTNMIYLDIERVKR